MSISRAFSNLLLPIIVVMPGFAQEWHIHAQWCANPANGSSYAAYINSCKTNDQYAAVLACQQDAAKNNHDGGHAVAVVTAAPRDQMDAFMESRKGAGCLSSVPPPAPPPVRPTINCTSGAGSECSAWSNGITCTQGAGRACVAWSNGMKCVEGAGAACRAWSNGVSCTVGAGMSCQKWSNGSVCLKSGGVACIEYSLGGPF
jgi:hypothetical protein